MGSDVDAVTKSGGLFHTRAAATGKAAMEERRERVLTPSAGAAAYRGRRHAGSRWRGTVEQKSGDLASRHVCELSSNHEHSTWL